MDTKQVTSNLKSKKESGKPYGKSMKKEIKGSYKPVEEPLYVPVYESLPISPAFINGKIECQHRGPRWFRSHERKLRARQRKKERETNAKEVRIAKAQNKRKAMREEPAPLPKPVLEARDDFKTAYGWLKDLRDTHQLHSVTKVFSTILCNQLPFLVKRKEGKWYTQEPKDNTNAAIYRDVVKMSNLVVKYKVEWLQLYNEIPCECEKCVCAITQSAYLGTSKHGKLDVPEPQPHPFGCYCHLCNDDPFV